MKNHHKHLTDNWKETLIQYFDNGDYEFKNKLFNFHRKKGLSASEHGYYRLMVILGDAPRLGMATLVLKRESL